MKTLKPIFNKFDYKKLLIGTAAVFFVVLIWQLLAVTVFKSNNALPPPLKVFGRFFGLFSTKLFYKAVFSTLGRSLLSFLVAFLTGTVLAYLSSIKAGFRHFINPIVTVLRSVPTLGATFILLMFYKSGLAAGIIAALVSMPIVYENLLKGFDSDNSRLLDMAKVYKTNKYRTFVFIVIPSVLPFVFASVLAGLTLNLKVVIAAEVIAIPRISLGSSLNGAYTSGDFTLLFAYVLTAVTLSFLLETLLRFLSKIYLNKH